MEIIHEEAGVGKTHKAIMLSDKTGAPIVCFDRREAERVADMAQRFGVHIPFPLSLDEALPPRMEGSRYLSLIVDNADMIIQRLFQRTVIAMTITKERAKAVANKSPNKRKGGSRGRR